MFHIYIYPNDLKAKPTLWLWALREQQSTRQLMGIERLAEHGVKTAKGELVFFMLRPDNLSVLSPEGGAGQGQGP